MARIDAAAEDAPLFVALAASLCLMLCMVVSLLGIKIWWFKHRLTFDHSASSNGAAGGTPPAVPMRQRSSKDKRASEQFRASTEVHGVFRKRQEDDFVDIVRPNQLPPVRMRKISQSTPSLLLPPRKLDEPITLEQLQPPTHEPPLLTTTTTTQQAAQVSLFARVKPKEAALEFGAGQVGSGTTAQVNNYEAQSFQLPTTPPQAPKRYNRSVSNEAAKAKSASDLQNRRIMERRPTGHTLGVSADNLQELEQLESIKEPAPIREESSGERSPIGYIRYGKRELEELQKLECIKEPTPSREEIYAESSTNSFIQMKNRELTELAKWESVKEPTPIREESFGERAAFGYNKYEAAELKELEELQKFDIMKKLAPSSTEVFGDRSPTGYIKYEEVDKSWQDLRAKYSEPVNDVQTNNPKQQAAAYFELEQRVQITAYAGDDEHMWQSVNSYKYEEPVTPEVTTSAPFAAHRNVVIEEIKDDDERQQANAEKTENAYSEAGSTKAAPQQPPARRIKFQAPENVVLQTHEEDDKSSLSALRRLRRPTSFESRNDALWQELQENSKHDASEEQLWLEMQKDIDGDFVSNIEEEFNKIRHSYHENEGAFLDRQEQRQHYASEAERKPQPRGFGKSIDEDWDSFENLAITKESAAEFETSEISHKEHASAYKELQKVGFKLPVYDEDEEEREHYSLKQRRPTGYVTSLGLYDELDREKDDNFGYKSKVTSYVTSIDEMFDEISKDKTEHFDYKTKVKFDVEEQMPEQNKNDNFRLKQRRPTGYASSVDRMFDDISKDKEADCDYKSKVRFDVEEGAEMEYKNENFRLKERRPTGYVTSWEMYDEISKDKSDDYAYKSKVQFDVEAESEDDYQNYNSRLKERRPTGFEQRNAYIDFDDDAEATLSKAAPEPLARTAKPRAKVTFDFNTEEHHYPAGYHHDFDSEEEHEEHEADHVATPPSELPKPMQRLAKIRYTEESFEPLATPSPPILFGTQVSLDSTSTEASDSWSAIRQHRYMTEEFQQLSLQQSSREPPKPAYRNPLAQLAQSSAVQLQAEADYKQRSAAGGATIQRTRPLDYEEYGSEA